MKARFLAPLLAAGMLAVSTGAMAGTIQGPTACQSYQDDLRQNLSLKHLHDGPPAGIVEAQQQARKLCQQGRTDEGVAVLKEAIASLSVPLRDREML